MKKWFIYDIFNQEKRVVAGSTIKDNMRDFSFSLALHTGEDREKILKNREEFKSYFDNRFKFVSLNQTHSSRVVNLDNFKIKKGWEELKVDGDGLVTSKPLLMLNILTADCIAILAYDKKSHIVGACHAGWRGTKENIAKNMVDMIVEVGAKVEDIICAISPSIRGCCYEVGEEVANHFTKYPKALTKKLNGKWNLDLSVINREQLIASGVQSANIEVSSICTSCQNSDYFSYRKECGCSGRFINFIGLRE